MEPVMLVRLLKSMMTSKTAKRGAAGSTALIVAVIGLTQYVDHKHAEGIHAVEELAKRITVMDGHLWEIAREVHAISRQGKRTADKTNPTHSTKSQAGLNGPERESEPWKRNSFTDLSEQSESTM